MITLTSVPLVESDQEFLDKTIAGQNGRPGALLGILEKAQEREPRKFLSRETLEYIAAKTDTPLARVYSVVTFYALFNLEPQGKNTICICRGTACHTRGSRDLLESLMFKLGFHDPEDESADKIALNTSDGKYTLRTVACFGQCALAPVVEVNHEVYGHMNEQTLQREMEHLERETAKK
ncbi:MAG: NAD(P)H-dependent oxidoreductase subunit E [Terriglobia bacterium]